MTVFLNLWSLQSRFTKDHILSQLINFTLHWFILATCEHIQKAYHAQIRRFFNLQSLSNGLHNYIYSLFHVLIGQFIQIYVTKRSGPIPSPQPEVNVLFQQEFIINQLHPNSCLHVSPSKSICIDSSSLSLHDNHTYKEWGHNSINSGILLAVCSTCTVCVSYKVHTQ